MEFIHRRSAIFRWANRSTWICSKRSDPDNLISTMGTEIELKLAVAPRDLGAATRLPWLKRLAAGSPSRKRLVSIYFDTPKFRLRGKGLTLRIRRVVRRRIQTITAKANGSLGALGRGEWEEDIATDRPYLKRAKGTALEPLVS